MLKLRELMQKQGLDDKALAKKLELSPSTIYGWRTGIYQPRLESLGPLCQALKCSVDELLGFETGKPLRLTRSKAKELYRAITGDGQYSSEMLHQMATRIRFANQGKTTAMERWLRELAETLYKIELLQRQPSPPQDDPQLRLL